MKILIIYGGVGLSSEAEVSKESGLAVIKAAQQAGLTVEGFCLSKNNIVSLKTKLKDFDIIFPVLHGGFGEDGQIQKILEDLDILFIGSGSLSSRLCFNKVLFKELLINNNILTPDWHIIHNEKDLMDLKFPIVVKPIKGGSSLGVKIIRSPENMKNIDFKQKLMIEEYIDGQEFTVGILGNKALPIVEIIPPQGEWFDYKNKYSGKTLENVPPKHIDQAMQEQIQKLSLDVHRLCGCKHLSRVDIIVKDSKAYVLEVNTSPGMTNKSVYPKAAKADGLDLPKLILKLFALVS